MLCLTRKTGEGFTIGSDVKIVIMEVKGQLVRVGIQADKDKFPIRRVGKENGEEDETRKTGSV